MPGFCARLVTIETVQVETVPRLPKREAESHKGLEWFFDDWIYRDHGLPEFKISNVYARESLRSAFLVTATVENAGAAAAETPIIVTTSAGDVNSRLQIPARSKAVARIEVGSKPVSVQVNVPGLVGIPKTVPVFGSIDKPWGRKFALKVCGVSPFVLNRREHGAPVGIVTFVIGGVNFGS